MQFDMNNHAGIPKIYKFSLKRRKFAYLQIKLDMNLHAATQGYFKYANFHLRIIAYFCFFRYYVLPKKIYAITLLIFALIYATALTLEGYLSASYEVTMPICGLSYAYLNVSKTIFWATNTILAFLAIALIFISQLYLCKVTSKF